MTIGLSYGSKFSLLREGILKNAKDAGEKKSLVHIFLYLEHFAQIGDNIRKTGKFQNRMILTLAYLTDLTGVRTCGESNTYRIMVHFLP